MHLQCRTLATNVKGECERNITDKCKIYTQYYINNRSITIIITILCCIVWDNTHHIIIMITIDLLLYVTIYLLRVNNVLVLEEQNVRKLQSCAWNQIGWTRKCQNDSHGRKLRASSVL